MPTSACENDELSPATDEDRSPETTSGPATGDDVAGSDAADPGSETADTDRSGSSLQRIASRSSGMVRVPRTRWGKVTVVSVLVVVVLAAAGALAWATLWRLPDDVAFRAGGQDVTVEELNRQMDTLSALYGMTKPQDPAQLDTYQRDFAKASAIGMVIDSAAAERGIAVAERSAQDYLGRYIQQYFGDGTGARKAFVDALGQAGTSEPAVLAEIKRQMSAAQLFQQATADVPAVTDADVETAFRERRDALAMPERRAVGNIVVRDEATAQQILGEVRSGKPFADVARARSADAATRDAGGAIGTLAAAQLEKPFADAAFGAQPNAPFGPVRTQHGWNVGVVSSVQPSVPADLQTVREPLRQRLQGERTAEAWRTFLGTRADDAGVRYNDDYLPADPDGLPADPSALAPAPGTGD